MSDAVLRLKKNQERRLRAGHCWVYSNEVDTAATPLKGLTPGQAVTLEDAKGHWLGHGYANPHSLICARVVSRDRDHGLDGSLLVHRLNIALGLRERLYPAPYYRLVFGESDGLPGLVADRFGDHLVVQITTAGMEAMKTEIIAALCKVLNPLSIQLRNDNEIRKLEGLERYHETAWGTPPQSIELEEAGLRFQLPSDGGQKTGWYYDQADNRARLGRYVAGKRVLDLFSYIGAWGLRAVAAGAAEVVSADASQTALDALAENAARNGLGDRIRSRQGDAFEVMKALKDEGERFDVVMLDPPAFIKRRKDMEEGALAYRRLNQMGLRLLSKDGILISSSCSHHMPEDRLLAEIQRAARSTDRSLQLLERGQQGPDHPVHPAIPETAYLKTFFLRVLPTF